jgi:hypothetical protein
MGRRLRETVVTPFESAKRLQQTLFHLLQTRAIRAPWSTVDRVSDEILQLLLHDVKNRDWWYVATGNRWIVGLARFGSGHVTVPPCWHISEVLAGLIRQGAQVQR